MDYKLQIYMDKFKIKNFNIFDLNFLLVFVGFSFFTTFTTIGSVLYRFIALSVACLCLIKRNIYWPKGGGWLKVFLILIILYWIRTTLGLLFYSEYSYSRNYALLFGTGVMLLPMLAVIKGVNYINKRFVMIVLCSMLTIMLIYSLYGTFNSTIIAGNDGRFYLNERQSTLSFGDNGAYLTVLAFCILNKFRFKKHKRIWQCALIVCCLVGAFSVMRAGSRGPFISTLAGGIFLILSLRTEKRFKFLFSLGLIVIFLGIDRILLTYTPVIFDRLSEAVEGDTNGRSFLFAKAMELIWDNPIFGSLPIMIGSSGFSGYHSYYLSFGVGLGLIGLVIIVIFIITLLCKLLHLRYDIKDPFWLFIAAMGFVIAARGITGIDPYSNCIANTTIALCSILIFRISR